MLRNIEGTQVLQNEGPIYEIFTNLYCSAKIILHVSVYSHFDLIPTKILLYALYNTETDNINYSSISDEEWRKRLTDEQFYIARKKGTERAFNGYNLILNAVSSLF